MNVFANTYKGLITEGEAVYKSCRRTNFDILKKS